MRRLVLLLAAFVLLVASPAWAKAPPSKPIKIFFSLETKQEKTRTHSCAKGGPQRHVKLPGSRAFGDLAHKAVVACEQPPRSQPLLNGLKPSEFVLIPLVVISAQRSRTSAAGTNASSSTQTSAAQIAR